MSITTDYIQDLYSQRHLPELAGHMRRQRAHDPYDSEVISWSALCAYSSRDFYAAYRFLAPLAVRSPRKAEVHALMGKIADALNIAPLRLHAWQAAINADPLSDRYRRHLAAYHQQQGNPSMAALVVDALQDHIDPVLQPDSASHLPAPVDAAQLALGTIVVLVPIYDDFEATRRCLQSVLGSRHKNSVPTHLLLINDASPEPAMAAYLADLIAEYDDIELLTHQQNRGFILSVNAGLTRYPAHDFVLLNADTVVSANWLDRLSVAAYSAADIASVTPLSNNGELVSFPLPMYKNTLPDAEMLAKIDGIAATVNSDEVIEIPVGVGFCLYLKGAALAEVGVLNSQDFQRGYGEEVDLCLRFRAAGWRNTCAPNVYVAHEGSKSFKAEKAIRVAQNNLQLFSRYPFYEIEYRHFHRRDQLPRARRAIQAELLSSLDAPCTLLVAPPRSGIGDARVRQLRASAASRNEYLLILWRELGVAGQRWRLSLDAKYSVSSQQFDLPEALTQLQLCLSSLTVTRVYLGQALPEGLGDLLAKVSQQPLPAAPQLQVPYHSNKKVIAVMPGAPFEFLLALAQAITQRGLPVRLWLQYATINDAALIRTGVVDWSAADELLDRPTHWRAGGVTSVWWPQEGACYDLPEAMETVLNEW